MDPVTITTAATNAAESAWKLYNFIKSARNVKKTVLDLQSCIEAYARECDLVESALKDLSRSHVDQNGFSTSLRTGDDSLMWKGVGCNLKHCRKTIDELWSAIPLARQDHSTFYAQAVRQFKLNMNEAEIERIQKRLRDHTSLLSLSFQLMTV